MKNYFSLNKYLINDGQNEYPTIFDAIRYPVLSREQSSPFTKRKPNTSNCQRLCICIIDNTIQSASTFPEFSAYFWLPLKLINTFHSSRKIIRHNNSINWQLFSTFVFSVHHKMQISKFSEILTNYPEKLVLGSQLII